MLEIETNKTNFKETHKKFNEMNPLEVGIIEDVNNPWNDCYVMRTASINYFEIMNLSKPGPGECWTGQHSFLDTRVRILRLGEKINIKLFNNT